MTIPGLFARWPNAVGLALGLLACMPAAAAETGEPSLAELAAMPLDALLDMEVTGASRTAQRRADAAASVSVITAEEIRALGHRTLADALRTLPGLNVVYDRLYSYLGVRGFYAPGDYNTRILLLIDGNRVNDNLYDQAFVGSEAPVDIDLVERIEFIPGQGSPVYGANAFFGVVNVITRRVAATGSSVAFGLGSGNAREIRATLSRHDEGAPAWVLAASRRVVDGNDLYFPAQDVPGVSDGWARGVDYEQRSSVYFALETAGVKATLAHAERLKGAGATVDTVFGDPRTNYRDVQTLLDLTLRRALTADTDWLVRAFGGQYHFIGRYALDYPPVTINLDDDLGRWWGLEARLFSTRWQGHALQVGAEAQHSGTVRFRNADIDPAGPTYLDQSGTDDRVSIYGEDRIALGERTSLSVGLRVDHHRDQPLQTHPRLALVHHLNTQWVLKAIHGSAFRPPNAFELNYEVLGPGGYQRNPALKPERVRGNEGVVEWSPRSDTRLRASIYDTQASELVLLELDTTSGYYMFRNLGDLRMRGLELEAERQWRSGWTVRANYSRQQAGGSASDSFAQQTARDMFKAVAIAPLSAQWTLGLDAQAYSRRGAAAGYGVVNVNLSTRTGPFGSRFSIGVLNLFDRAYDDPGTLPDSQPTVAQDGRNWRLRFEQPF